MTYEEKIAILRDIKDSYEPGSSEYDALKEVIEDLFRLESLEY